MKNKGFTLIELLAVIIILALIAVITVPKINEQVDTSKKNLAKASAYSYQKAVEEYILEQQMNKNNIELNETYGITKDGYLYNKAGIIKVSINGEKPKGGSLVYNNNDLISGCIAINKYAVTFQNGEVSNVVKGECTNTTTGPTNIADGLYEAQGEPGRLIYRGTDPNNYIWLDENGDGINNINGNDVKTEMYRIISYEPDGTIKVVRNEKLDISIEWDTQANRQNTASGYYCNSDKGCNVWGNQSNTYYNGKTLSSLNQDFYFYYYPSANSTSLSTKPNDNYGTVTTDSSLNTYLNGASYYNTLDFKDKIETHSFNVGGIYYYNTFNNGYSGGDKGLLKEKQEEQVYTWNGKIALMNITEYVETSLSPTCTSVYSNYYYQPNNVTYSNPIYTAKYDDGKWPCALQNWNYKSTFTQWTLTASSNIRTGVWCMHDKGYINHAIAYTTVVRVRPAFYLKAGTVLSGTGTENDPFRIVNN